MTLDLATVHTGAELSPADVHLAARLAQLAGEQREEVIASVALASQAVTRGHVCLELATSDWTSAPDPESWAAMLRGSTLVGEGPGATPLVLDSGRLYLRRYWHDERELAAGLRKRARASFDIDPQWLHAELARMFGDAPETAAQRRAAEVALRRRLCVISGGPGTGKTSVVVKLLALICEAARRASAKAPRVALLAPTGRAAARLEEAVRAGLEALPEGLARPRPGAWRASTVHRALGLRPGRQAARAAGSLRADVVVVDEASMVDLSLMATVVASIPASARLILLGDRDQLASVEAGAVLGDICGERRPARGESPVSECICVLRHSFRYPPESGIRALADAIQVGDADAALEVLEADRHTDVSLRPPVGAPGDGFEARILAGYAEYLEADDPAEMLRRFGRFRVVCAHQRGPGGVADVNQRIEAALRRAGLIPAAARTYAGQPLGITRNDHALELYNGDVGLRVRGSHGAALGAAAVGAGQLDRPGLAVFPRADGSPRPVASARLPAHELVYATSIHKSQGSEFDAVVVCLPAQPSPILSRELLYTAVTRARERVSVYAPRDVVRLAIDQRIRRTSGLQERLWRPA